ncbi:hypothetical protein GPJ56_009131 [Histomonas meleagridis]|uniref:uncharacterized protein n=1 Tax=Histomonas meleagridis TaxID=135588 RepID=UPI00355AA0F8|nr:hypothetical protein GPJ56_009131 [Histomonas meleagridis]KAH0799212.1 hypothetical protein GO595_008009 [Histomonas meleagridis]
MEAEDEIQSQIQPQFPPEYLPENRRCIDWSFSGLIAYATGPCVHLSHARDKKLIHVHSIEVAPYTVSCLRFHPTLRIIAVGDIAGRLFLWEIDNRRFIASAKPLLTKTDRCTCLQWKDDLLLVLLNTKKLIAVKFTKGSRTENLINFSIIWKVNLPCEFKDFSIDPYSGKRILFHGYENVFSIYTYNSTYEAPTSFLEEVALNQQSPIKDAQWSLHIPNYIIILIERDLLYFNIESTSLIQLIDTTSIPSSFLFLVQFPADHTQFITFHKNSTISVYHMQKNHIYFMTRDFQCKLSKGTPLSAVLSPLNDNHLTVFYSDIGLAFFDIETFCITSIDPTFPSDITSYDSDGTWYVLGTKSGYIILGNLFDTNDTKRFKATTFPITFISYDIPKLRIYWQTTNESGIVDLNTRKVTKFKSHGTTIKCYGSHHGALIVERDQYILGVFIDGKEYPLILKDKIIDLSIDEQISNQNNGKFYVLQQNHSIMFFAYEKDKGIIAQGGIRPRQIDSDVLCFTYHQDNFAIGYSDGTISYYNIKTQISRRENFNLFGLKTIHFNDDATILFGLYEGRTLFSINGKEIKYCPYTVKSFKVVNDSLLLIQAGDNIVKFIRISDWRQLNYISKYLPPPMEDENLSYFISNRKEFDYYSNVTRDVWTFLKEKDPKNLRLHSKYCINLNGELEKVNLRYLSTIKANENLSKIKDLKFASLIFLNKFEEASELIFDPDPTKENFFFNALYSTLLLIINGNTLNEKVKLQLKTTAISLFSRKMYLEGSFLMKIAGLDKEAALYLMEDDMIELSLRFIRNMNDNNDMLIIVGCKLMKNGKTESALPMFAGAKQFHAVLFALFEMGLIPDAYFIMKFVKKNNLLFKMEEKYRSMIPKLIDLEELCKMIEQQFQFVLTRLGIKE